MIFLIYVVVILFISGILIMGIDAIVHTHRYERWIWPLILISRIRSASVLGMNIDKVDKDADSLVPSESFRILFTRIWGGVLIVLSIIIFGVLIAVFAVS